MMMTGNDVYDDEEEDKNRDEDEMGSGCVLLSDRERIVGILVTQRAKAYGGQLQL